MTKKLLKIAVMAAVAAVISSTAASAGILPGMDGGVQPALIGPVSDSAPNFSPFTTQPTYNDDDALLGFRVLGSGMGAGFEGIIDLGPVSQFNHTFTLSLGSVGSFMTSNFGSDWYTRMTSSQVGKTDIQWAVVATDSASTDLWSTRNPAVRSTPWTSAFDQGQPSLDVSAVGAQYANASNSIAAGTTSAVKESASGANTWTSYQPGGTHGSISFQFFNPTNEGNTSTVLAFDDVPAGTNTPGTNLGTFSWAADGTVTFTAVPEPSTYAMFASGGALLAGLMFLRRRRAVRA